MSLIYEPKGAAREYAPLALNLYLGCSHRCRYCYVPSVLRKDRAVWEVTPPKRRALEFDLAREASALRRSETYGPVFMCFMCDPYQEIEAKYELTRAAIQILTCEGHGQSVRILTKAGMLAQRDFDLLRRDCRSEFGVTLTFCRDIAASRHWEPGAALPWQRIENLKAAKAAGIRTWVSLEPVLDSWETLTAISWAAPYTDKFYLGKLNHMEPPSPIDWPAFRQEAEALFAMLGVDYEIKKALREA